MKKPINNKRVVEELERLFHALEECMDTFSIKYWIHSDTYLNAVENEGNISENAVSLKVAIPLNEWREKTKEVYSFFFDKGLNLIDTKFTNFHKNKIFGNSIRLYGKAINCLNQNGKKIQVYPSIKITLTMPDEAYSYTGWKFIAFTSKNWRIWSKGFRRYNKYDEEISNFFKNTITFPLKILINKRIVKWFYNKNNYKDYESKLHRTLDYNSIKGSFFNIEDDNFEEIYFLRKSKKSLPNCNARYQNDIEKSGGEYPKYFFSSKDQYIHTTHTNYIENYNLIRTELKKLAKSNFYEHQEEVKGLYAQTKEVLDEVGIRHWLHSGSVLGIERHDNDFIPWDDDIDVMVSSKEWESNLEEIVEKISATGNYLIDYKYLNTDIVSDHKIARIYSKNKLEIINEVGDKETFRPFIDIFFAVPANYFKTEISWKFYEKISRNQWTYRKGFDRYLRNEFNLRLQRRRNWETLIKKLIYIRPICNWYLERPFKTKRKKHNWDVVRRADAFSSRKVVYDLNNITTTKLRDIDVNVVDNIKSEILEAFGEDWFSYYYVKAHAFNWKHKAHRRNIQTNEYIDSLENEKNIIS